MSALDQHDYALSTRVADLEARIHWLETSLAQLLGEPPGRTRAIDPVQAVAPAPEFDLWMLRTQAMPPLEVTAKFRPITEKFEIDPTLFKTRPLPVAADGAPPQVKQGLRLDRTQPLSTLVQVCAPAPKADLLGLTSAFETLDAKVAEVEAVECLFPPVSLSSAPVLEIQPELIDRAFAPPKPCKIDVSSALEERHPSILQKLVAIWRQPEAAPYLKKLILDDRGTRHGFDPAVMSELLLLNGMLEQPAARGWNGQARAF